VSQLERAMVGVCFENPESIIMPADEGLKNSRLPLILLRPNYADYMERKQKVKEDCVDGWMEYFQMRARKESSCI
jgi:hypothetical protein